MVNQIKIWIVFIEVCCLLFWHGSYAQTSFNSEQADSIKMEIAKADDDTNKVHLLNKLAMFYSRSNANKGVECGLLAANISERLNWKPGMAAAYNSLGANYKSISDYPKALDYFLRSLKINEDMRDRRNIARNTVNIGSVYRELKNYPKALEYYDRSMKENVAIGRKFGIENNLNDMAIIYSEMKDQDLALKYFLQALKIAEEIGDKEGKAIIYGNIANVYNTLKEYNLAVENINRSLELNEALHRRVGIAVNYVSLAQTFYIVANDSNNTSNNKLIKNEREVNLDKAIYYYSKSIALFHELSSVDNLATSYSELADVYVARNDYKNALDAYKHFKVLKDSIYSIDNTVKLAKLTTERAEFETKQQEELTKLTQMKRRNETAVFIAAILLLTIFTAFVIKERTKSEKLLLNILPRKVAAELKKNGKAVANNFDNVTVLFTDFVNFTSLSEKMEPNALVKELNTCFKAFDEIISKYGIEKIKTVGDAYIAVSGLPEPTPLHAENIIRAALEIRDFVALRKAQLGDRTFDIRIGVNSGSVVAGIVGLKKFAYDIWGDTVNTAARMEQNCESGKVNISQATYDLTKMSFECTYRGEIDAKGKGLLKMYYVA